MDKRKWLSIFCIGYLIHYLGHGISIFLDGSKLLNTWETPVAEIYRRINALETVYCRKHPNSSVFYREFKIITHWDPYEQRPSTNIEERSRATKFGVEIRREDLCGPSGSSSIQDGRELDLLDGVFDALNATRITMLYCQIKFATVVILFVLALWTPKERLAKIMLVCFPLQPIAAVVHSRLDGEGSRRRSDGRDGDRGGGRRLIGEGWSGEGRIEEE